MVAYRVCVRHNPKSVLSLFCVCALAFIMLVSVIAQASNSSPWFTGTNHTLTIGDFMEEADYNELLASRRGFDQGQECIYKNIAVRPLTVLASPRYKNGCWYNTKLGLLHQDGSYLLQPGEEVAGNIKGNFFGDALLKPTPNPDVFLDLQPDAGTGHGYLVRFRAGDSLLLKSTKGILGGRTIEYVNAVSSRLQGANYHQINVSSYVWYSSDAKWMFIWNERGVLYRVNLENLKMLAIYVRDQPAISLNGSVAVSPSGRYAAVTTESSKNGDLFIIDMDTCDQTESELIGPVAKCSVQSEKALLAKSVKDFVYPTLPRFYDEHTLGFYHKFADGRIQHTIQANGTSRSNNGYIALGDSFSSGEGAGAYEPGTDILNINMCHTSRNSYPYLINKRLNLSSFHSVACSGAKIDDVTGNKEINTKGKYPDDYIAGQFLQKTYVVKMVPNIMTITMSGNDIHFAEKLVYCITSSSDCYGSYSKRKQIANEILLQYDRLKKMYKNLINTADSGARLYVVGYPQIASGNAAAKCGANVQLNAYQRIMANDMINFFNAVIKSAANAAGAFYVGTESSLNGHKLCEGATSTVAINGITAGNETGPLRTLSKGSFHPNKLGHQLLASAILNKTNYFTAAMPKITNPAPAKPNPDDYPFLGLKPDGKQLPDQYYANMAQETFLQNVANIKLMIENSIAPTLPYSTYNVSLHSDPIDLGHLTSDGSGSISGQIKLPDTVTPGMHELRLRGPGLDGDDIEIYQYVYVSKSEDDFNADGIPNSNDPCGIFQASGLDQDEDKIDDACDDLISIREDIANNQEGVTNSSIPDSTENTAPSQKITIEEMVSTGTMSPQETTNHRLSAVKQQLAINPKLVGLLSAKPPVNEGVLGVNKIIDKYIAADTFPPQKKGMRVIFVLLTFTVVAIISYSIYRYGKNTQSQKSRSKK